MRNAVFLLKNRLLDASLIYECVGGGGDCAFKVLADGVYGNPNRHMDVREIAAKTMMENLDDFAYWHFKDKDEMRAGANSLSRRGTWVNIETDLHFASLGLNAVINVIGSTHTVVIGDKTSALFEVNMAHITDIHFAAARKVDPAKVSQLKSALNKEVEWLGGVTLLQPIFQSNPV